MVVDMACIYIQRSVVIRANSLDIMGDTLIIYHARRHCEMHIHFRTTNCTYSAFVRTPPDGGSIPDPLVAVMRFSASKITICL